MFKNTGTSTSSSSQQSCQKPTEEGWGRMESELGHANSGPRRVKSSSLGRGRVTSQFEDDRLWTTGSTPREVSMLKALKSKL